MPSEPITQSRMWSIEAFPAEAAEEQAAEVEVIPQTKVFLLVLVVLVAVVPAERVTVQTEQQEQQIPEAVVEVLAVLVQPQEVPAVQDW